MADKSKKNLKKPDVEGHGVAKATAPKKPDVEGHAVTKSVAKKPDVEAHSVTKSVAKSVTK